MTLLDLLTARQSFASLSAAVREDPGLARDLRDLLDDFTLLHGPDETQAGELTVDHFLRGLVEAEHLQHAAISLPPEQRKNRWESAERNSGLDEATFAQVVEWWGNRRGRSERYREQRVLGQGRNGVVTLCHDTELDRLVAVKRSLRPGVPLLSKEAKLAARVEHQNVVRVYDGSLEKDYIVSQYVDGETLEQRMRSRPSAVQDNFFDIAHGLLSGLAALYEFSIVHRDLKPANILFAKDSWIPMINDFGLALEFGEVDVRNLAWRYMPVEAWHSGESVEPILGSGEVPNWDIHSLGVIFYEIWEGNLPFGDGEKDDILLRVAQGEHSPFRNDSIPPHLSGLISRMLKRSSRPRSVGEVRLELKSLSAPDGPRLARFDDFRQVVHRVYSRVNGNVSQVQMAAHISANIAKSLRYLDPERGLSSPALDRYLPHAAAWICALATRLNETPSELFAMKYGDVCPFCSSAPCDQSCSGSEAESRRRLLERVKQHQKNTVHADWGWMKFRQSIDRIYGPRNRSDVVQFEIGTLRDLLSLGEAVAKAPLIEVESKPVISLSLATVIARFFAVLGFAPDDYDLADRFLKLYGQGCPDCDQPECSGHVAAASSVLTDLR